MWVKICGNTNLEDALFAAESGADALGFIFAKSPRRVTPSQVAAITAQLPVDVEKIGVFAGHSFEEIIRTVTESGLTGVQLHDSSGLPLPTRLRQHFGTSIKILRVLHFSGDLATHLSTLEDAAILDGVLIDSRTATAIGGTGISFDWNAAQQGIATSSLRVPLIVAGGLHSQNVAEAIHTLHPWGVDVSSGVEASPGKKDPAKVKAFMKAAKAG